MRGTVFSLSYRFSVSRPPHLIIIIKSDTENKAMTTTDKTEKKASKNLYKKCVLEGYENIATVTGALKVTLGYITKFTVGDANYQNNGFKPKPLRDFAEDLGISTKTASAHIHILEQLGFIKVARGGKNEHDANVYTLTPQYEGLSKTTKKTQDMTPEQPTPAPVEENIDWKEKYDALYEKAGAEWRKKSKECKQLQAKCDNYEERLKKANEWKKGLGTKEFIEAAVAFYEEYSKTTPETCNEEKQVPQTTDDEETQKLRNSLELAVNDNKAKDAEIERLKEKLDDQHLNDEKNRRIADLEIKVEDKDKEIKQLNEANERQKQLHEAEVEELKETIGNLNGAIKILQNDIKQLKTGEPVMVTEETVTEYGNVKKIKYN